MAVRYWAKVGRRKVYGDTLDQVEAFARSVANQVGRVIAVGFDEAPAPRRRRMKSNPLALGGVGGSPEFWRAEESARRARLDYLAATKARRLAVALRQKSSAAYAAEAKHAKTGKFVMHAKNRKEAFTLYRPSRKAAEALGAQFEAAGYLVSIRPA